MKITLSEYEFVRLLMQDDSANWTREAAFALFDYYENLEQDSGTEMEFDRVAIRCEWNLCESAFEVAQTFEHSLGVNPKDFDADCPHDCKMIQKQIEEALENEGCNFIKLKSGAYLIFEF